MPTESHQFLFDLDAAIRSQVVEASKKARRSNWLNPSGLRKAASTLFITKTSWYISVRPPRSLPRASEIFARA